GLTNSTIINNTTSIINYSGGYLCLNSTPTITNCIFYNNNNGNIVNVASIPVIKNSLIQGSGGSTAWVSSFGTDAGGNKDQNPLLTADFRLTACSPAVDAGHNAIASSLDLDKNIRIRNTTVDMGCYESNINTSIYGSRVYVDAAATGNNDGTSWANAFTDLQTALGIANCTGIIEIYVSKGTYYPTNDLNSNAVNNQFATFQMKNNLSILGGFSVVDGATSLALRNPSLYVTTLSGNIQNDNVSTNNVFNIINNYDVVLDTTAILDGFTVSGAYNNITGLGGGVINRNSSPKFLNCTFKDNFAGGTSTARGGGVHNINSSPIFRNCTFTNNNVSGINNGFGAGLSNDNSSPKISRCKFTNNTAQAPNAVGGGMYSNGGYGVIDNTLFSTNTGGAICADGSVLSMFNSTIAGNYGNTTTPGGLFLINGSGWYIANSIIYGNTLGAVTTVSSSPTFFYSNVEGSMPSSVWNNSIGVNGGGNRDIDPQFTPDYHLSICSPLVNGGDNGSTNGATIDLDNTTRIKSALVDFGCYESVYSNVMVYGTRLYVNATNTNTVKDGNSWGTAFTSLEDALTFSRSSCVTITEIYVSKGTYYPINNTLGVAVNNQYSCFQMKNNLSIIGGFSIADGITTLAARNPTLYPATLSGDIQQDGIDGNNVYNVINNFNTGIDTTAVLDGFYITGAWNNITGLGGGVINANTSPKFINCTIWGNFAGGTTTARGAGMHNINASPIIRKCSFVANNASGITAAFGAGLSNDNSFPKIEQCVFKDNIVNAANPAGGGIYSNGAGGSISNSLFTGNNGTAICADASIYTLYNTTIANNNGIPSLGRAGGLLLINSNFNILNSIVYGNSNGSVTNWSSTPTFYYSNVEGSGAPASWDNSYGINGGGNTSSNPLFTSDFRLQACSPLINAGDGGSVFGSVDLDNTARIKNGVLDVGCYETADIRPAILSAPEPAATFGSNTVTLNATVNGSNSINWYTSPTGGTSLFTGTSFTTSTISTSTYYYVEASNGTCATMPRVAIRAAVFPMYYSTGSNDAAALSNWNTQSNGTGNAATSFTDTARFIVQTGHILTLNGNNNLSFANNLLTIQANASMAINGTGSIQLAGNLVNDGIITGTGVVELNGSSAQTISGTGIISNLTINNAAGVSLLNEQKITGTLIPTLGVLTTNGNLTLTSNTNGTARIAAGTGNYIIGNVTVERFIPAGKRGFRFLTPTVTTTNFIKNNWQEGANNTSLMYANNQNPVPNYGTHITGSTTGLNGFDATLTGNPSLMQFDNATQTWNTGIANTYATNLIAGNAYRLMVRGDRSIDL
ncbi:MAG: beta strand repeat-containing protein, partial [Dolichospermum sp.]